MATAFQLEIIEDGIALVTLDQAGSKVNVLSAPVMEELAATVGELEGRDDLGGLLLRSGKPGQFIAGADLKELAGLSEIPKDQVAAFVARGHELFDRISNLPYPTVALIDGPCLGGGTELVLAMDDRIASSHPKTRLGLPEVTLGIIPSWGGTQRLPRLIELPKAIDMICSGQPLSAADAHSCGLVSDVLSADRLVEEGVRRILEARGDERWQRQRARRRAPLPIDREQEATVFAEAEDRWQRKTKGHYPAPLVAIRTIRQGVPLELQEGLRLERAAALELMGSRSSANLIAVFFMRQRLARDPGVPGGELRARPVRRVGILGAGLMGSGIAAACAQRGVPAVMVDVDQQRTEAGLDRIKQALAARVASGRATEEALTETLERLTTGTGPETLADCDLVIEAIVEDEAAKQAVCRSLADVLGPDAIVASNTSTISINRLAESAPAADRFCGLHFFNPADRMPLVEVVRGRKTSDETVATAVALAKRIGKTPIVVRDAPGFLVNRVLFPYLNEAVQLLLDGASMDAIDRAATAFGMPMGPILLHDVIGLDVVLAANRVLGEAYGDRMVRLPIVEEMVEAGRLGQKVGLGFRKYEDPRSKGSADPDFVPLLEKYQTDVREVGEEEITDRLMLPMLLEATRVLEEGIVREPADVDMGLILGMGFPTFRGGLLRWCDEVGAHRVVERLERYAPRGARFQPTERLQHMARSDETFYPSADKQSQPEA